MLSGDTRSGCVKQHPTPQCACHGHLCAPASGHWQVGPAGTSSSLCALGLPLERDVIVLGVILSLAGGCIQGYLIYSSFVTPVQLHGPSCPSWAGLKHGFRSSIRKKGRWSFLRSLNTLPCHSQEHPSCCWGGGMLPAVCAPLEQGLRAVFLSPPVSTQIPLLSNLETDI